MRRAFLTADILFVSFKSFKADTSFGLIVIFFIKVAFWLYKKTQNLAFTSKLIHNLVRKAFLAANIILVSCESWKAHTRPTFIVVIFVEATFRLKNRLNFPVTLTINENGISSAVLFQ